MSSGSAGRAFDIVRASFASPPAYNVGQHLRKQLLCLDTHTFTANLLSSTKLESSGHYGQPVHTALQSRRPRCFVQHQISGRRDIQTGPLAAYGLYDFNTHRRLPFGGRRHTTRSNEDSAWDRARCTPWKYGGQFHTFN